METHHIPCGRNSHIPVLHRQLSLSWILSAATNPESMVLTAVGAGLVGMLVGWLVGWLVDIGTFQST